jgi:integrase
MVYKMAKITTELVENLRLGETVMDCDLRGFMVRRQKGEACIYAVRKYANGKRHFETIGEHGRHGWTEARARKKAVMLIGALHKGQDPAAERALTKGMPTLVEWAERYLSDREDKLKPKTLASYRSVLDNQLAPRDENGKLLPGCLGGRRLDAITRRDVEALHGGLADKKRTANLAVVFLSALYSLAQLEGLISDGRRHNPAHKIDRYQERKRERYLTAEELGRLGEAIATADGVENPYALAAFRLLILTGARLGEILTLRWQDVDFERGQAVLSDHKSMTTGRSGTKTIHLNPAAMEVLGGLHRIEGNPYIIVGDREGRHLVNLRKIWVRIRDAAALEPYVLPNGKVEPVRIHDLRHSFASALTNNAGANLLMIGKLLGHSNPSTTQRYAHLLPDQIKRHNDMAGKRIATAMSGKATQTENEESESGVAAALQAVAMFEALADTCGQLPKGVRERMVAAMATASGKQQQPEDMTPKELTAKLIGLAAVIRTQIVR